MFQYVCLFRCALYVLCFIVCFVDCMVFIDLVMCLNVFPWVSLFCSSFVDWFGLFYNCCCSVSYAFDLFYCVFAMFITFQIPCSYLSQTKTHSFTLHLPFIPPFISQNNNFVHTIRERIGSWAPVHCLKNYTKGEDTRKENLT